MNEVCCLLSFTTYPAIAHLTNSNSLFQELKMVLHHSTAATVTLVIWTLFSVRLTQQLSASNKGKSKHFTRHCFLLGPANHHQFIENWPAKARSLLLIFTESQRFFKMLKYVAQWDRPKFFLFYFGSNVSCEFQLCTHWK